MEEYVARAHPVRASVVEGRRGFLFSIVATAIAAAAGYSAFANQQKFRIAIVHDPSWTKPHMLERLVQFAGGAARLDSLGYVVQPLAVPVGNSKALRDAVKALQTDPPKLIVALGDDEVTAIRAALPWVPIIFWCNTDPTTNGMALSFPRPGANATGATSDWAGNVKPLEFLAEVLRDSSERTNRIGIVSNERWFAVQRMSKWIETASAFNLDLTPIVADSYESLAVNERWLEAGRFDALVLPISTPRVTHTAEMVSHLREQSVLSMFENFQALTLGAALGYQHNTIDWEMQLGTMVRLAANGVDVGSIPIRGPDGWSFAVNREALVQLGIELQSSTGALVSRVF